MAIDVPTATDIEARIQLRLGGRNVPITDLTPISPTRQLIRSMLVEELQALWRGLAEANDRWYMSSPNATIADIARRVADFGGPANPGPTQAYGTVLQITVGAQYNLSVGTLFATTPTDGSAPLQYAVMSNPSPDSALGEGDGSWRLTANVTRTVAIQAVVAGSGGNTSANTITTAVNPVPSLTSLTNLAIGNGRDALDAPAYWGLFKSWLLSLKGTTPGAVLYNIVGYTDTTTGRRVHSISLQRWNGTTLLVAPDGTPVNLLVYIDEGTGAQNDGVALADSTLVEAVRLKLSGDDTQDSPGLIDAGLPFAVVAASAKLVPVTVTVDVDATFNPVSVVEQVRTAINVFFASLAIGGVSTGGVLQGQVVRARLFKAVADVPGVLSATFSAPTGDVAVPLGYKAVAGELVVTGQVVS